MPPPPSASQDLDEHQEPPQQLQILYSVAPASFPLHPLTASGSGRPGPHQSGHFGRAPHCEPPCQRCQSGFQCWLWSLHPGSQAVLLVDAARRVAIWGLWDSLSAFLLNRPAGWLAGLGCNCFFLDTTPSFQCEGHSNPEQRHPPPPVFGSFPEEA